jgi:hypothetical protein
VYANRLRFSKSGTEDDEAVDEDAISGWIGFCDRQSTNSWRNLRDIGGIWSGEEAIPLTLIWFASVL